MKKDTVRKQIKKKKRAKKRALDKKNREKRYFTKTKNITATIYFLFAITIALLILLTYLGFLDFKFGFGD